MLELTSVVDANEEVGNTRDDGTAHADVTTDDNPDDDERLDVDADL